MFRMTVGDVFFITGRGVVATGKVDDGVVRVGDEVRINDGGPVRVQGIEAFRKTLDQAQAGDNIGLLMRDVDKEDVNSGDVITGGDAPLEGAAPPAQTPGAAGRDPRFAEAETQRAQFLSMREAGLMTDEQIEGALSGMAFNTNGRNWKLTVGSASWYSSDGGEWKHDTPPDPNH